MKILFLTRLYWPHIGGVEKPVRKLTQDLIKNGHSVIIITEKYERKLKKKEIVDGGKVIRFEYPKIKFIGLLYIWFWLFKNRELISQSDIVHCHDVFIWYLPYRFLFPSKRVFTTFHGWEGKYPIPRRNILLKQVSYRLSLGNICVGKFIEKYYGIKANFVTFGAVDVPQKTYKKQKNSLLYLGRLDVDTGLPLLLQEIKREDKYKTVDFCGDGPLKAECAKFGEVHGFINPARYLKRAEFCVPGGYFSALEAMITKCKIKIFWNNSLKRDYWKMTPFYRLIKRGDVDKAYVWAKDQSWGKLTNKYLMLWGLI